MCIVQVLSDPAANLYVDGIAVHWYMDDTISTNPGILDEKHELFPDKFMMYSEACNGTVV